MNALIINHDGSIKLKHFPDMIIQGNDLTDEILVGFEGYPSSSYTAIGKFLDEADNETSIIPVEKSFSLDENYYEGYSFTLTAAQTLYEGRLLFSLEIEVGSGLKYSYEVNLVVNPSNAEPTNEFLGEAQMRSLATTLEGKQGKYIRTNVRGYISLAEAEADSENLAYLQFVIVGDGDDTHIYQKTLNGTLKRLNIV